MVNALATVVLLLASQTASPAQDDELRDDLPPKPQPLETTDEFGRGGSGTVPAWRAQAITLARLRFGIGSTGLVGVQSPDYTYTGYLAGGFGLSAEAGVIFHDRFTVMWRGELATSIGSILGTNGFFFDLALGEHFAVGIGSAFTMWGTLAYLSEYVRPFVGFTFPLRAHWNFGSRATGVARREGWTLSAHFAPGVSMYPSYGYGQCFDCSYAATSAFAFTAGAGVGYLWW